MAECSVPLRNFLGSETANVFQKCSRINLYAVIGFCLSLSIGIFIINRITQRRYDNAVEEKKPKIVVVPMWTTLLPLGYLAWYYFVSQSQQKLDFESEKVAFQLSGKTKPVFLADREADDRQARASKLGLLGTTSLALTNLLGPVLLK
jgi:hypothetical protein